MDLLGWLGAFWQDVRYGLRILAKNPGLTTVTVLTLALGIGATTGIFSMVEAVLLRPLPGRDPGQLVAIFTSGPKGEGYASTSYPDFEYWQRHARSFSGLLAYARIRISWTNGQQPEDAWTELVSGNYFDLLGVKPIMGRAFLADEDGAPGAHPVVVVVSYDFWREHMNSSAQAIGAAVTLNDQPFTVIGVAPEGFEGVNAQWGAPPNFWLPISMQTAAMPVSGDLLQLRQARWLLVIGRLKPGATFAEAKAEGAVLSGQLAAAYPLADQGRRAILLPGREGRFWPGFREEVIRFLSLLAVAVGLVLLIACSNAANLLLAWGAARKKEISVRLALGASRGRVVRKILTEDFLLALAGGAAGLLLALLIMEWLPRFRHQFVVPMAVRLTPDPRVLGFVAAASLLTLLLAGIVPALVLSKADLNEALREGAHHASPSHGAWRFRQGLIISEVALTTVALIGAGLLLLSVRRLQRVNPGFDPHHVLAVGLDLHTRKYSASDSVRFYQELTDRLRNQPGILSATLTEDLPLSLMRGNAYVTIPAAESEAPREGFEIQFDSIAPQYLQTLRIPLLEGREFTVRDDNSARPVVIINRTMAERFWPGQNPVDRMIRFLPDNTERQVIGVAQDIKYHTLWDTHVSYLYLPMYQSHVFDPTVLVRTTADPLNEVGAVRRDVAAMDQFVPIVDVTTLDQQAMDSSAQPRAAAEFISVFALLALVLAAAGIYGMLSYWVAGRTHEIGIRLALGAHRGSVLKLVVGQGFKLTLIGLGLGVVGSLALMRFLSSVLYGIGPGDPLTFSVVALILGVVTLLASYIPARRAIKVEPSAALKCG